VVFDMVIHSLLLAHLFRPCNLSEPRKESHRKVMTISNGGHQFPSQMKRRLQRIYPGRVAGCRHKSLRVKKLSFIILLVQNRPQNNAHHSSARALVAIAYRAWTARATLTSTGMATSLRSLASTVRAPDTWTCLKQKVHSVLFCIALICWNFRRV
jgi:hypothetical protein